MSPAARGKILDEAFQRAIDLDASLGEQLTAFADAARISSPDFAAAVDRLVDRLRLHGAGSSAPQVGEPMPSFVLPDDTGRMITLERLLQQGSLAVTFHRGHWCPYCQININALAQAHNEVASDGGQIVAIMPDRQKFAAELKASSAIPFPILTDVDNGYAMSLGLAIWVGAELQKLMEPLRNVPEFQGNSSWLLPIRATFVVGRDGVIKGRFIEPDYRRPIAIAQMLSAMRDTARGTASGQRP
ncbi:MAG: peroxiredoxin-like family protein [Xanthobacteraceae bacterium]